MKQQVIVIHGGDSFSSQKKYLDSIKKWPVALETFLPNNNWKLQLQKDLGSKFQVLAPQMPNKDNARYAEWIMWFERMIPYIRQDAIWIGHSLGGMFLAKYFAEQTFPKKVKALILVAAPHNNTSEIGDFRLPKSLQRVTKQVKKVFLYHSPNDPIVPFSELHAYEKDLPSASSVVIQRRGHFGQEKFPEILRLVQKL